ncbi:sulfurtransferase [Alcaligenes faecalis]|mgnify:CR=1 FL=1|uniref:sulfurtransferase n=1 Tax=Alcaligenes faecalis TaxID=511 RepID=UPI0005A6BB4E|nr:3-mercaptopyruvate sulfurtransferase [Alcaligenes faecalis]CAJ0898814.1 putative 3-mercaptopyruvate sulfurtransferase [Alcaligenes faecalis subsp. faecalis]GAU73247.1 3-mercaptopyruvate sulfurtransferase [Alcaligenes faecalis subsp. faecalis NBRC 13111]ATH98982.1 sulfurtransferase [Alcaligenes faecalis]AYZ91768.1 sulfurtransferase [Alcaligenes faecalis]
MFEFLVSAEQVQANLDNSEWLILDVRHDLADHQAGRRAYEQGHIPGAVFLDHEVDLAAPKTGLNGRHPLPSRQELAQLLQQNGLRDGMQVVVYDAQGSLFASHMWWMLRWLGHPQVAILDGGWQAWQQLGGAEESGSAKPVPAAAKLSVPEQAAMPTVQTEQVLKNLSKPIFTVLDARAAERYRGDVEPMDPVAGHIPDALNRSHLNNLGEQGRFKPAEQLRQEFQDLLGSISAEMVVHQCGSGITACHNLFAMELAGLSGSSIYPGSWSEWVSDASRPVARS